MIILGSPPRGGAQGGGVEGGDYELCQPCSLGHMDPHGVRWDTQGQGATREHGKGVPNNTAAGSGQAT